ncbi:hypothetical protein [Streptococcus hillyeri]|uniref:Phage protein n=1 Tax=Streptococcus hillyeri TaxID=2282420 RepID=A0A3L9DTZ7_9STRE|nr:hypothetical protein [Streptococcus hillyeri]RLY02230.1 hypothetical protein EAF07_08265 [Streptococcus hillyeri]
MNQDQQLNQALRLTVNDLTAKLVEESTTKNLLAIQLTEAQKNINLLNQQKAELEALLDTQTQPDETEKGE